jgi:receptor expression-enhancing protein 1/2/3/4
VDGLRVLFGYAMPAFECFKTLETRPDDAHMLRFWCQYWSATYLMILLLLILHEIQ